MKKAKVERLLREVNDRAFNAGRHAGRHDGIAEERRHQTEYLQAKPGTLDMAPPPARRYLEVAVPDGRLSLQQTVVRFRAREILYKVGDHHPHSPEEMFVRFFIWEPCP